MIASCCRSVSCNGIFFELGWRGGLQGDLTPNGSERPCLPTTHRWALGPRGTAKWGPKRRGGRTKRNWAEGGNLEHRLELGASSRLSGVEGPVVVEEGGGPAVGVVAEALGDVGGRKVGDEVEDVGGVATKVFGEPVEELGEFCGAPAAVELVTIGEEPAALVVELVVEAVGDVGFRAKFGAGDGGANESEVDAGILELGPDDLVLDMLEGVGLSTDDCEGEVPGLAGIFATSLAEGSDGADGFHGINRGDEFEGIGVIGVDPEGELGVAGREGFWISGGELVEIGIESRIFLDAAVVDFVAAHVVAEQRGEQGVIGSGVQWGAQEKSGEREKEKAVHGGESRRRMDVFQKG